MYRFYTLAAMQGDERQHAKAFHSGYFASVENRALLLDLFVLVRMVPQWNASGVGRSLQAIAFLRVVGAIRTVTGHRRGGECRGVAAHFALQQHALPAGKFRPLARMLLPLHGGKTRPQEDGMFAVLGIQPVDAVIDAAHPLGLQHLSEEVELGVASPRRCESTTPVSRYRISG